MPAGQSNLDNLMESLPQVILDGGKLIIVANHHTAWPPQLGLVELYDGV